MANPDGVVTDADVRAAQNTLDGIVQGLPDGTQPVEGTTWLEWRGWLAAEYADVRTAGYLEGLQVGRREAAHVVLDALQGEGLAP